LGVEKSLKRLDQPHLPLLQPLQLVPSGIPWGILRRSRPKVDLLLTLLRQFITISLPIHKSLTSPPSTDWSVRLCASWVEEEVCSPQPELINLSSLAQVKLGNYFLHPGRKMWPSGLGFPHSESLCVSVRICRVELIFSPLFSGKSLSILVSSGLSDFNEIDEVRSDDDCSALLTVT